MRTIQSVLAGGSLDGFLHTLEAARRGIRGNPMLEGTQIIVVGPREPLQCAPELVLPLSDWLFLTKEKGGRKAPDGWHDFRIYHISEGANDPFDFQPFGKFQFKIS